MNECAPQVIARLNNQEINDLPKDLYIDPNALLVFLDMFEGPLDLLLYLIRKQNIDILNIPIAKITDQYISYINAMTTINIDLASEYLAMAATLLFIKSRVMLPTPPKVEEGADNDSAIDPRTELINRLIEYEQIKQGAKNINEMPMADRDYKWLNIDMNLAAILPKVVLDDLKTAWQNLLLKAISRNSTHQIEKQELSVREHMTNILRVVSEQKEIAFEQIFVGNLSIPHIVVNFIAVLELTKEGLILLEIRNNVIILLSL